MFAGFYNDDRLKFIHEAIQKSGWIIKRGESCIRKTGVFYGGHFNFYIDTSDGMNIDLNQKEYCGRIIQIINECKGKPFVVFKTSFSPTLSSNIVDEARKVDGDVVPFFIFSYYPEFHDILLKKRDELLEAKSKITPTIDMGFYAGLNKYLVPKPDAWAGKVSCEDWRHFGTGSEVHTGYYEIHTRRELHDKFKASRFTFAHKEKVPHEEFLRDSFHWKVCINPPGCGEYTPRILEHAALGQCVVLRKSDYDNAISWNGYFPQIDFNAPDWEDELQKVIDNYEYWGQRAKEYYDMVYQPDKIVAYMKETVNKYLSKYNIKIE